MKQPAVKSKQLNAFMIATFMLLTVVLVAISFSMSRTYRNLNELITKQAGLQEAAYDLQKGSDYLTEQVRLFTITQKKAYADNFFKEVNETKRRDNALIRIEESLTNANIRSILENALEYSNELMQTEEYAIRLVAEAIGDDLTKYDAAIQNITLTPEDLTLTAAGKLQKGQALVFDQDYTNQKVRIYNNIDTALDAILENTGRKMQEVENRYRVMMLLQNILFVVTLLLAILFIYLFTRHYVQPLLKFTKLMEKKEALTVEGSEELRIFAKTYNKLLEQIKTDQVELTYEASHDSLTGLYNRKIFDDVRTSVHDATMLLIDIDNFKGINDTYGHEIGDRVLQKLSKILSDNFRHEDYVCRIGGDEFAVIMMHVSSSLKELVENKIKKISAAMGDTSDGLPFNSLSIGVAFADRENATEDIYVDCDKALYAAKDAGRNTYRFY